MVLFILTRQKLLLFRSPGELVSSSVRGQLKLQELLLKIKKKQQQWNKVMLQREIQRQNMCVLFFSVLYM